MLPAKKDPRLPATQTATGLESLYRLPEALALFDAIPRDSTPDPQSTLTTSYQPIQPALENAPGVIRGLNDLLPCNLNTAYTRLHPNIRTGAISLGTHSGGIAGWLKPGKSLASLSWTAGPSR